MALPVEDEARAIVYVARRVQLRWRMEKKLLVDPLVVFDPATDDSGHRGIARAWLRVREVNPAVLAVLRVHLDVEQPAVLPLPDGWRSGHGLGQELAVCYDPQPAWPLRNQQSAIRQEGQAPGRLHFSGYDFDLERQALRFDDSSFGVDD